MSSKREYVPTDREVADAIDEALGLFGKNGENWIRNAYERDDRFCAVGAINRVTGVMAYKPADRGRVWAIRNKALEVLADVPAVTTMAGTNKHPGEPGHDESVIVYWNDTKVRSFQPVRNAFVQARAKLRRRATYAEKRAQAEAAKQRLAGLR